MSDFEEIDDKRHILSRYHVLHPKDSAPIIIKLVAFDWLLKNLTLAFCFVSFWWSECWISIKCLDFDWSPAIKNKIKFSHNPIFCLADFRWT